MTFTATYRDRTGAMREERVEAASRSEAMAALKAQGIVPIRVEAISGAKAQRRGAGNGEGAASRKGTAYVLSAVFVLLAGVGLWWWLGGVRGEPALPPEKPKSAAMPKEVKPAAPRPGAAEPAATNAPPTKDEKRAAQLKAIRDRYGDNIPDNLKPVVYFLENPPQRTFHPARTKTGIFKRRCEREIAAMVMAEPGTWFMRRPTFNERFDEDFRASLGEKIEFEEGDTDEQRALKQAVIETKAELAERMKAGESPSAAMNAFAGSMYELGQYRRNLQEELGKIKRDARYSDQDVQDFVNAANKMLEEKGAQPIPMPKMVFRQVSLKRAAAKAEEKAKKEKEEKR